jgi:hypothetical protein
MSIIGQHDHTRRTLTSEDPNIELFLSEIDQRKVWFLTYTSLNTHTHTHTHTYIYIYIYKYRSIELTEYKVTEARWDK